MYMAIVHTTIPNVGTCSGMVDTTLLTATYVGLIDMKCSHYIVVLVHALYLSTSNSLLLHVNLLARIASSTHPYTCLISGNHFITSCLCSFSACFKTGYVVPPTHLLHYPSTYTDKWRPTASTLALPSQSSL